MNPTQTTFPPALQTSFINAANQSIMVRGIPFAYRDTCLLYTSDAADERIV